MARVMRLLNGFLGGGVFASLLHWLWQFQPVRGMVTTVAALLLLLWLLAMLVQHPLSRYLRLELAEYRSLVVLVAISLLFGWGVGLWLY